MHQQVEYKAERSATVAGQWVGIVVDSATKQVLTHTSLTFNTQTEARFGARVKWIGRAQKIAQAAYQGCVA